MRFNSLQVLRAIAAISVLIFHVQYYVSAVGNAKVTQYNILGYGAILFFGISGFLMTHLIETGYKNFLIRRATRIYPLYILLIIAVLLTKSILKGIPIPCDIVASISLLPVGHVSYQLGIEWTLVYEVFFYIVCSVFTFGYTRKYFHLFLWLWLAIVLIANNMFKITPEVFPTIEVIFFQLYNMFFIVGGLTYYAHKKGVATSNNTRFALLCIVCLIFATWPYWETLIGKFVCYAFAICLVIILLSSVGIKVSTPETIKNVFVRMGDYSYALYLVHVPILIAILKTMTFGITTVVFSITACLLAGWWIGKFDVFLHNSFRRLIANGKY